MLLSKYKRYGLHYLQHDMYSTHRIYYVTNLLNTLYNSFDVWNTCHVGGIRCIIV